MATMHLGTEAGTLCGKPLARRWWFQWPPERRIVRIGNLSVLETPQSLDPRDHSDCKACIRAAEAGKGAR